MKIQDNIKEVVIPTGLTFGYCIIYFKNKSLNTEREKYIKLITKALEDAE